MLFRKKYSFLLNQNKDLLTESLKKEQDKKQVIQGTFSEVDYKLKFDYDRWIISSEHNILRGLKIKPDASIRLTTISDKMTEAEVTIKLSTIWLLFVIFMHLGLIATLFFGPRVHYTFLGQDLGSDFLNRAAVLLCNIALFNLVIWITFLIETSRLKKLIEKIVGTGQIV